MLCIAVSSNRNDVISPAIVFRNALVLSVHFLPFHCKNRNVFFKCQASDCN